MSVRHDILAALDSAEAFEGFKARTQRGAAYHLAKFERQTARREARNASPRVQAQAASSVEAR